MLDSLLYEPSRRRSAMWVLLSLSVLSVGFVALGMFVADLGVLVVFGVAFIAAAMALLAKLLVVSHVHIRGTAGRLEALNDRYDATSRWLEGFDADTRESFLAAGARLDQADADRLELLAELEKLGETMARGDALAALRDATEKRISELSERLGKTKEELSQRSDAIDERVELASGALESGLETVRAEQASGIEAVKSESLAGIEALRGTIESLAAAADRVEAIESRLETAETALKEDAEKSKADLLASLNKAREELEDKIRLLNGRVTKFNDEHERKRQHAAHAVREQASAQIAEVSKRVDDSAQLAARQRGDGYVQFPRLVTGTAAKSAESFKLKVSPAELKYLERKLHVIEGICEGRLAGSADDAVGRVLASRMVKGKQLQILEIGVLFGIGAAFMHHTLVSQYDRVRLTLLDPFEGYYGKDHLDPLTGLPVTRAAVERNLARCGIPADDYEFLEGFSTDDTIRDAAEAGGPYHVVVIDGDHSAEGIRADFERYAALVRANGVLLIDDYGSSDWPAVTEYVDSVVKEDSRFKLVSVVGKTAVFKRGRSAASKSSAKKAKTSKTSQATNAKTKTDSAADSKPDAENERSGSEIESKASADVPVPVVPKRGTKKAKAKSSASSTKAESSASS